MRYLLFLSIWVLSFTQTLQAQNAQQVWADMEVFLIQKSEVPIPNEDQIFQEQKMDLARENGKKVLEKGLLKKIRKSYWENIFIEQNRDRIFEAKRENNSNVDASRTNGATANPPLVQTCALNIVVIVDRSASINNTEATAIRNGLLGFVNNQVGTGNTVTFIGMGANGGGSNTSQTVTYNPGNTGTHNAWVNGLTFTGSNDSWSSALNAAANITADLVLIITDGDDGNGANECMLNCQAANVLKANGSHLFVFGQGAGGSYDCGGSLVGAVTNSIDPTPVSAGAPPTMATISNSDFVDFGNNFNNLGTWLGSIRPGLASVATTNIWPRTCILHDFTINGNFTVCAPLTATSLQLQFWRNGVFTGVSVPATLNGNGTWTFSSTLGNMTALGLNFGTWYDVIPVLTLSNGTIVTGTEFIAGQNNDLYFAAQSDPMVIVNDNYFDNTTPMTRFCEGSPIFYHGTDPLSENHFSAIRRRPIGSSISWDNAEYADVGWVGSSLNYFTADLNAQYPGYFHAGFEYQLYIASSNGPECIAWSPVTVVFEVIDCCTPDWELTDVPECVNEGEEITVTLTINAPLNQDDIESIYSNYNNYTYISHTIIYHNGSIELVITFRNEKCTCEGEILVFDVVLKDCETPPIWVMTDPIPCCSYECDFIKIVDWHADEECILLNGDPARKFCIEVQSDVPILGAIQGTNNATCQVDLHNLQITNVSTTNVYTICGVMRFTNPNCTYHATVSLILETERGCCEISQGFSFPEGCVVDEECQIADPDIQLIYINRSASINVSLNVPKGQTLTVIDHNAGTTQTVTVGTIKCGPFAIDQNGTIFGGSNCNGITFYGPEGIDCHSVEGVRPSIPYFFEIQYGNCIWILTGDYCRETLVYPAFPNDGSDGRSAAVEGNDLDSQSGQISVFPNPMEATDLLNFDVSNAGQTVKGIQITNTYGKVIESFVPTEGQNVFQYQLKQVLPNGIYLVVFQMADGTVKSTRLASIK